MKVWTSRMLAVSLAGHDKGNLYVVVEEVPFAGAGDTDAAGIHTRADQENSGGNLEKPPMTESDYVCLADGKSRTLEHPKRKKVKHVQLITRLPQPLLARMSEITLDAHVRKIVKQYRECR